MCACIEVCLIKAHVDSVVLQYNNRDSPQQLTDFFLHQNYTVCCTVDANKHNYIN